MNALEHYFGIQKAQSSLARELMAGLTTFLTMAYILFVNPNILSAAIPVDTSQILTTTAIAAAFGSLTMGLLARHPIALAPGMGLNAYFAYTVVGQSKIPWQAALGAVFLSGLIFVLLSVSGARQALLEAIPRPLRQATAGGIGLFLAFIGLRSGGFIVPDPNTTVRMADLSQPEPRLFLLGLIVVGVLSVFRLRGALLIGIFSVALVAIFTGAPVYGGQPFAGFTHGIVEMPAWPKDLFFAMDIAAAIDVGVIGIILIFFFVDLFDTAGTLSGLAEEGGLADESGQMPRTNQAFTADALATVAGACLGTSTTTTYVESVAGIKAGGRTGLTAVVVGLLFLASTVFWPIAGAVPAVATAPVLVVVGSLMIPGLSRIAWQKAEVALPCFLTTLLIPFTFSIANGVSAGIIAWVIFQLPKAKSEKPSPILMVLAVILVFRYIWLAL